MNGEVVIWLKGPIGWAWALGDYANRSEQMRLGHRMWNPAFIWVIEEGVWRRGLGLTTRIYPGEEYARSGWVGSGVILTLAFLYP